MHHCSDVYVKVGFNPHLDLLTEAVHDVRGGIGADVVHDLHCHGRALPAPAVDAAKGTAPDALLQLDLLLKVDAVVGLRADTRVQRLGEMRSATLDAPPATQPCKYARYTILKRALVRCKGPGGKGLHTPLPGFDAESILDAKVR